MMLAIQRGSNESDAVKVNLLPCKVNYDGPVEAEKKYWSPEQTKEGKNKAYFRGRELEGNSIKVPEGYRGSILRVTNDVILSQRPRIDPGNDEDEVEQPVVETKSAEELGTFDEVMVWNHDVPWDASEDTYAKGVGEWMSFANAIHSHEEPTNTSAQDVKGSQIAQEQRTTL